MYKLLRFFITWKHFIYSFHKNLQKPLTEHKLFCSQKAFQFGIKKPVKIWLSNYITTPITYGFLKPAILLPVALVNQLTTVQVETIILHELSHIKANDYLFNWILLIVENIFFFNPFVQIACNNIRLEREKACDLEVIHFNYTPILYAEVLLQIQKNIHQAAYKKTLQFQLAAVKNKKHLLHRIQYFTNKNLNINYHSSQHIFFKFGFLLIALLCFILLFNLPVVNIKSHQKDNITQVFPLLIPGIVDVMESPNNIVTYNSVTVTPIKIKTQSIKNIVEKPVEERKTITKITKNKTNNPLPAPDTNQNDEFIQVSYNDEGDVQGEQITIKEEVSGSDKIVYKIYYTAKHNGKWILIPAMIAAANPTDSTEKTPAIAH
ncbi:MAG: M56 family metallopeptidase [Chitinophagaceae bacterium]|nr:M56 family metallopeptidase [Chitinophagaceae bacterium]